MQKFSTKLQVWLWVLIWVDYTIHQEFASGLDWRWAKTNPEASGWSIYSLDLNVALSIQPYSPKYYRWSIPEKGQVLQGKAKRGCVPSLRTHSTLTAIITLKNHFFYCIFSYGPRIELIWGENYCSIVKFKNII